MEERAGNSVVFSHMASLAVLSAIVLVSLFFWRLNNGLGSGTELTARNPESAASQHARTPFDSVDWQASNFENSTSADPDGLSNIGQNVVSAIYGSYATLAETGLYTPEVGEQIASDIARSLHATISYPTYTADNIQTDPDTSHERMMRYRNDMRIALEPLLKNKEYELGLFALYIETNDQKYALALQTASSNYRKAVEDAAKVTVPVDAADEHVEVLNALSAYGSTLEKMATYSNDAFAAAALYRTYEDSELRLFTSFEALAKYGRTKS